MLEFIDLTSQLSAQKWQNEATTQRAIRSHAMKNFRRRQREGLEKARPVKKRTVTKRALKVLEAKKTQSKDNSPTHSRARRISTTSNVASSRTSSSSSPPTLTTPTKIVRWRQPSALGNGDNGDLLFSPSHVAYMTAVCVGWSSWLCPGLDEAKAATVSHYAYDHVPSPMILAATALAAIGHSEALDEALPRRNCALYKATILKELTWRVRRPQTAASPLTVSALLLLATFELSRLSLDAVTHLGGLLTIIKCNGGSRILEHSGLPMMIETIDIVSSFMFDAPRLLPQSGEKKAKDTTLDDTTPLQNIMQCIMIDIEEYLVRRRENKARESRSNISGWLRLHQVATRCFAQILANGSINDDDSLEIFHELNKFSKRDCETNTKPKTHVQLARAYHQAVAILYNAFVNRDSLNHESNAEYAKGLLAAFLHVPSRVWDEVPRFRTFVYLLGMASSQESHMRSYFQAQLIKGVYQTEHDSWRKIMDFVLDMTRLKRLLKKWTCLDTSVKSTFDFSPHKSRVHSSHRHARIEDTSTSTEETMSRESAKRESSTSSPLSCSSLTSPSTAEDQSSAMNEADYVVARDKRYLRIAYGASAELGFPETIPTNNYTNHKHKAPLTPAWLYMPTS